MDGKVRIGKVSRLHGYKGELSLKIDKDFLELFTGLDHVFLEMDRKATPFFIDSMRLTPQGFALVFFDGVSDQREAERLRGAEIWIEEDVIPSAIQSSRTEDELIGYTVQDEIHGSIGSVDSKVDHPGNSFLVVERDDGQVLIPMHDHILKSIDHKKQIIHVHTPEGLIELNLD